MSENHIERKVLHGCRVRIGMDGLLNLIGQQHWNLPNGVFMLQPTCEHGKLCLDFVSDHHFDFGNGCISYMTNNGTPLPCFDVDKWVQPLLPVDEEVVA